MTAILAMAGAAVGYFLSLLFEFAPSVKVWHEKLSPKKKRLLHQTLSVIAGIALLWLSCYEPFANAAHLACVPFNAESLFALIFAVYGGNQLAYNSHVKFREKGDGAKG